MDTVRNISLFWYCFMAKVCYNEYRSNEFHTIGGLSMGIYLNPNNGRFLQAVNSRIYVDKSPLIAFTNERIGTEQKNICVSRPRRFGKSINLAMLAAYYSKGCDSRDLFAGLSIASSDSYSKHLKQCLFPPKTHFQTKIQLPAKFLQI